jgi:hypothetical protein
MTRQRLSALALLCATALPGIAAFDAAAGAPMAGASAPRTGAYKIARRGPHATRARCLEGGNVLVPTHEKATAAQRDRDIRDACKTVDYTK